MWTADCDFFWKYNMKLPAFFLYIGYAFVQNKLPDSAVWRFTLLCLIKAGLSVFHLVLLFISFNKKKNYSNILRK